MIVVVKEEDGVIKLTREELESLLKEAESNGFDRGFAQTYHNYIPIAINTLETPCYRPAWQYQVTSTADTHKTILNESTSYQGESRNDL